MKIAIIGWGSLIWDSRDLPKEGVWQVNGPKLPIEFSRISHDARLTLVIDPDNGKTIQTMYVLSPRTSLDYACEDLRKREGTSNKNIGWVDVIDGKNFCESKQDNTCDAIYQWCREQGFDAAVWTALTSNFKKETETDFSIAAVMEYLAGLPKNVRKEALKYISNAPDCVNTPVRQEAQKRLPELF